MRASDYRRLGREALEGNWPVAIGAGIVASILTGGGISFNFKIGGGSDVAIPDSLGFLLSIISILAIVMTVMTIVKIIIGGAVQMGYAKFNLNMADGYEAEFGDLFSYFNRLWTGFCMQFFMGLFTILWTLLLIVPGIIAAFSYSMTPYILAENPDMTAREAIAESKYMMKGHKWELFCLGFSFIGWYLLASLTLGIGLLWVIPYQEASMAAFYKELKKETDDIYEE